MKRFRIMSRLMTTNDQFTHALTDSPAEAKEIAEKLIRGGGRDVEVMDAHAEKFYDLPAFIAAHGLK